jgi:hypothetical protein
VSGERIAAERADCILQPGAPWAEHLIPHGGINRQCSICSEAGGAGRRLNAFSCCNGDRLHPREDQLHWYVLNVYSKCLITVVIAASVVDWASVLEHTIQGA